MHSRNLQKGSALIIGLALIVILGVAAIFASKVFQIHKEKISQSGYSLNNGSRESQKCSTPLKLGVSPIKVDDLGFIIPLGRMSDSHVTPTDHQYWTPKSVKFGNDNTVLPAIYDIYSPADGTIVQIENHTQVYTEGNAPKINDWRLVINHNCGVSTIFIHIDKLTDEVKGKLGRKGETRNGTTNYQSNIPVKEGQLLGKLAEHPFDFSVHDQNITLSGFLNPKRYEKESWKIHTVDPFDYFAPQVREKLLTKVVRKTKPQGGKIDYDIEGKLVGNWFRQGSDPKNIDGRFWDAELTIAYNNFDPSAVFVSLGNFGGRAAQFAIRGNSPDPKDVEVGQTVKYEVVDFKYQDAQGNAWNENSYNPEVKLIEGETRGTILARLKDKNTLTLETFPGKPPSEVSDFTSNAQIYER